MQCLKCGRSTILWFVALLALSAVRAPAATMTFTPDRDTVMISGPIGATQLQNYNFGNATPLEVGGVVGNDERSILSFNVGALGSPPITVQSITLQLTAVGSSPAVTLTPEVHAITEANQAWVEGTGSGSGLAPPADNGMSTWNAMQSPGVPWAGSTGLGTPNTDYTSTALSSLSIASYVDGDKINFNFTGTSTQLTALIAGWLADNIGLSRANPGLLLFDPNAQTNPGSLPRLSVGSREAASGYIPELIVTYTPVSTPEPASISLALIGMALAGLGMARRKFGTSTVC